MQTQPRQAPKREGCKEAILALLEQHGGEMPVKELDAEMEEMGYSYATIRRAKDMLKGEKALSFYQIGSHSSKQWKVTCSPTHLKKRKVQMKEKARFYLGFFICTNVQVKTIFTCTVFFSRT